VSKMGVILENVNLNENKNRKIKKINIFLIKLPGTPATLTSFRAFFVVPKIGSRGRR
jgi:hypothetical protein